MPRPDKPTAGDDQPRAIIAKTSGIDRAGVGDRSRRTFGPETYPAFPSLVHSTRACPWAVSRNVDSSICTGGKRFPRPQSNRYGWEARLARICCPDPHGAILAGRQVPGAVRAEYDRSTEVAASLRWTTARRPVAASHRWTRPPLLQVSSHLPSGLTAPMFASRG